MWLAFAMMKLPSTDSCAPSTRPVANSFPEPGPLDLTAHGLGAPAPAQVNVTVEERIEAATRALGYFERSHSYDDFQPVLATLLEVNGTDPDAAPLDENWQVREQQIKEAYGAWFLIFRALDGMKLANHDPLAPENRCYLNIAPLGVVAGMDPKDVNDEERQKEYDKALEENRIRCDRNNLQIALPRLDVDAQAALHKFLVNLSTPDRDTAGSYFAYALGKSGLPGERSNQMWSIFEKRMDAKWQPETRRSEPEAKRDRRLAHPLESGTPRLAKEHLAEWLESGKPREAAWAAHYILRDKQTKAIPLLLAYVHKHAFDPVFEAETDYSRQYWPEVHDAVDAMQAVLDPLIVFRVRVPADDLLQIAPVTPDHALILGILPEPQEPVLLYFYLTGGVRPRQPNEYYPASGSMPQTAGEWIRWVSAGNILANQGSGEFVQRVFGGFTLKLHLWVVGEHSISTGSFVACGGDQHPGRDRGTDWPPVGTYGLLVPNVAERGFMPNLPDEIRVEGGEPEGKLLAPGGTSIRLVRRVMRKYGYAQYSPPCPRIPAEDVKAHWLEKLGTGKYGKSRSYDPFNPGMAGERMSFTHGTQDWFQFYELITIRDKERADSESQQPTTALDEKGYHAELKNWIAAQREVYQKIVEGMRRKNLIIDEQMKQPLKIEIYGVDSRMPSAHSNVTFLAKAPWNDLAPPDTDISWAGPQ